MILGEKYPELGAHAVDIANLDSGISPPAPGKHFERAPNQVEEEFRVLIRTKVHAFEHHETVVRSTSRFFPTFDNATDAAKGCRVGTDCSRGR